ncbi:MAG TPA: POTRA domain-containing protein [Bryobacteraceae bacterium]|nr:POTRA domain-containing protein [Bryobacteraceae bacterium]
MIGHLVAAGALFLQGSLPLHRIGFEGNGEISPAGLEKAAGLELAKPAGTADFDAACTRLLDTGLVMSCRYKYAPSTRDGVSGYSLTFQIEPQKADQQLRFTVPGIPDDKLWAWLDRNEPLVRRTMPANDAATAFYVAAVERAIRALGNGGKIVSSIDTDLSKRQTTLIFRPANLPKITDVAFSGNKAISADVLRNALRKVAVDSPFTEYDFLRLLDLNVRPLYESLGRLNLKFVKVTATPSGPGVAVNTAIDEGIVYSLSAVRVQGTGANEAELLPAANFPTGQVANWNLIQKSLAEIESRFRNLGYLSVNTRVDRELDEGSQSARLKVQVNRGPQYKFGKLVISGLTPGARDRAAARWKLKPGEPMSEGYVGDFIDDVLKNANLGPEIQRVGQSLEEQPGNVVNVSLNFHHQ